MTLHIHQGTLVFSHAEAVHSSVAVLERPQLTRHPATEMIENMQSFGPAGLGLFFQLIFSKVWDNLQDNKVYQNSKLLIHSSTAEIKLIYEQTDFFQDWQQRVRLFGGKTFFLSWQLSRNVRSRWLIAVYFKSGWKTYKMNVVKMFFGKLWEAHTRHPKYLWVI